MNNKFYADYLIRHFSDSGSDFDINNYTKETENKIINISNELNSLKQDVLIKNGSLEHLSIQIQEKENQILKLKDFITQKSGIESLKTQIQKLSENLNRIGNEKNVLIENKIEIENQILELHKKIKILENKKSDLELSLEPAFELGLQNYINQTKEKIHRILEGNQKKIENQKNKLGKDFEIKTKNQYPLDDFQDIPEILDALKSTFETEKQDYIDKNISTYQLKYSQNIIDIFLKSIQNYEEYTTSLESEIEFSVDYKHLDSIYKTTLNRNKRFFPYIEKIKDFVSHPLFQRSGELTLEGIKSFSNKISKKQDKTKFKNFYETLNTIILDYNIPIVTISDEIINQKSLEERDSIIRNPEKASNFSEYIIIDKQLISQLQKIINLFNDTRPISFKGFEDIMFSINNLLQKLQIQSKENESLYQSLNKLTKDNLDELNNIVDDLLTLVEKNNIGKNIGQQIMIFQNIVWTIYTYFQEIYGSDNLEVYNNITILLSHVIEKMYIETFGENMIEDDIHKKELFTLYTDIGLLMKNSLENQSAIKEMKQKIRFNKPISTDDIKNSRLSCLFDVAKKLTHFIILRNIYDISQKLFTENKVSEGDREAGAELYMSSPDFKVPPIDPILISADKFGTGVSEYMFESYDISNSTNYLAYIRLFNISDFKKYEEIKKILCKNGNQKSEQEKIKDFLKVLIDQDKDLFNTSLTFQEFTPLFVHKNFEISIDGINSDGLKFIIGDKNYEMLRTYLFYNFMEANRDHDSIVTTPKDLISPCKPQPLLDHDSIRIITINPDMPRTVAVPRGTGGTKNFEYKRETIVIQNPKCTTGPSGFREAKKRSKKLYAHVHNVNEFPTRKNSIEKIRLDTCDTYEEFLEKLEEFRKKYSNDQNLIVRVETYRSEFEKYEGAKQKVAYKIGKTQNAPSKILGGEILGGEKIHSIPKGTSKT